MFFQVPLKTTTTTPKNTRLLATTNVVGGVVRHCQGWRRGCNGRLFGIYPLWCIPRKKYGEARHGNFWFTLYSYPLSVLFCVFVLLCSRSLVFLFSCVLVLLFPLLLFSSSCSFVFSFFCVLVLWQRWFTKNKRCRNVIISSWRAV